MAVADSVLDHAAPVVSKLGPDTIYRFHRACKDWIDEGAQWVDLPWTVPKQFTDATRPMLEFGQDIQTPHGMLLASGEQAFLWMDSQNLLPPHCHIGWTPCFRDEPVIDRWHRYGFMKVEAYQPLSSRDHQKSALMALVDRAQSHFERWSGRHVRQRWFPDGTCDIEINGVEVGSYGIRRHPTHAHREYLYGTVLAEPRFSEALNHPLC